jgi:murein DD-endopeptidase MepM/ murein hydrolase activator NlpD
VRDAPRAKWQDRAGNYVVLQGADGQSYAYMHMQAPAEVRKGQTVRAGQQVGRVGDTGRASGCHLHFEQWTAPGWYEGGKAIDPLPLLRSLDG